MSRETGGHRCGGIIDMQCGPNEGTAREMIAGEITEHGAWL